MTESTEERRLVAETTHRLFADHATQAVIDAAEDGTCAGELWDTLAETGLAFPGISDAVGGSGGSRDLAFLMLRLAGYHGVPLPLADSWLAAAVLDAAGRTLPGHRLTIASGEFAEANGRLTGAATGVAGLPWCEHVVCVGVDGAAWLLAAASFTASHHVNMAGEPRSDITCDVAAGDVQSLVTGLGSDDVHELGALTRACMMAGALERALELAVTYAGEREQFGRPIARFQAIQHQLAVMAGEVAAAGRAADAAVDALGTALESRDIASAKCRVGEAVGIAAEIAHQVHGAIGYTREHALGQFTRRAWCWRDEYGNEADWAERLGAAALAAGADGLWDFITAES